jgi:hypothetical protein
VLLSRSHVESGGLLREPPLVSDQLWINIKRLENIQLLIQLLPARL